MSSGLDLARVFRKMVNKRVNPEYYQIIKEPIALSQVKVRRSVSRNMRLNVREMRSEGADDELWLLAGEGEDESVQGFFTVHSRSCTGEDTKGIQTPDSCGLTQDLTHSQDMAQCSGIQSTRGETVRRRRLTPGQLYQSANTCP